MVVNLFVTNEKGVGRRGSGSGRSKRDLPFGSVIFPGWFSLIQEGFKPLDRIMGLH